MRSKERRLLELAGILHRSDLLKEGEDDLFGDMGGDDEGGGDEEEGDEEGKDEEGDEGGGDEGGDAEEGEGDDEEEEEKTDPVETLTPADIAKYGAGEIDDELNGILEDIYVKSLERAKVRSVTAYGYPGHVDSLDPEKIEESLRNYSLRGSLIVEENEAPPAEEFDLHFYAKEVARYIKNYQTLLDMEGMIFNKARQMLLNQFGSETESEFVELLEKVHDLDFDTVSAEITQDGANQPLATGAKGGE